MRPITVNVNAVGVSPWIPLDYQQRPFNVALMFAPSADATGLAAKVEYSPDSPQEKRGNGVYVSRAATVATVVTALPHGLSVGDSVLIIGSGSPTLDGSYSVASVVSETSFTYTVANTGPTVDNGQTRAVLMRVFPHDTMTALAAKADGNFAFPCLAVRLNVTAITGGFASLTVVQGLARG